MKRELLVGTTFFALLGVLLATTIWVKDPNFLKDESELHRLAVSFRSVEGLQTGNEVWLYGTPAGRVTGLEPDGRGGVRVDLTLDYEPTLHADYEAILKARSALGGMVVAIHPGTPDHPVVTPEILEGRAVGDPLQQVGEFIAEVREPLSEAIENIRKVSGDLSERSEAIAANIEAFSADASAISSDLREGKGTLGKLLSDDQLYEDLREATAGLKQLGEDINGGGTIDLLLHDEAMAEDLRATAANLREVSDRLEQGQGTLGKLLYDQQLYDELASATRDLKGLAHDARHGDGMLAKLVYDAELGRRMDNITADVEQITGKLRRGEGTLGKLIQEDTIYVELEHTLEGLSTGATQARENAPILTFAGLLFGSF